MTIDDAEIKRLRERLDDNGHLDCGLCGNGAVCVRDGEPSCHACCMHEQEDAGCRPLLPALLDDLVAARQLAAENFAASEKMRATILQQNVEVARFAHDAELAEQHAETLQAEVDRLSHHEDSTVALRTIAAMLGVESGEQCIEEIKRLKKGRNG